MQFFEPFFLGWRRIHFRLRCFHAWDWASILILSSETTQFKVSARGLYQEIIDKLLQPMGIFDKFLKTKLLLHKFKVS